MITLMPIMPPVLDSLLKPDLEMATTFRLFLRDSVCIVDPAIMPNSEQIAALRAEQQAIEYMAEPQCFDGDRKIQLARLNALKQQHPSITELLSELYDIEMYAAGFAIRNALSFAGGLNRFQDAVFQLESSQLKLIYLKFLQYFRNIAKGRHE